MRKSLAAVATAATLSVGGLTVAALNPIQGASAQSSPSTTAPKAGEKGTDRKADRPHPLKEALDGLVKKGTLTREQADAVLKAVEAQAKADWKEWRKDHPDAGRPGRPGRGPGFGVGGLRDGGKEIAKALGISTDDLRAALKDGKSIADVAKDKGVSEQKVIDAIVDAGTKRIDQAVKDGKLDEDRAAKLKERLPDMAKRIVEAKKGDHPGFGGRFRGPGMRPGSFGGPGGPGGDAPGTPGGGI